MSPSRLNSSSGPVSASRWLRFPAEIVRAVSVIWRSGRSTRPEANQPSTADAIAVNTSSTHEVASNPRRSAE